MQRHGTSAPRVLLQQGKAWQRIKEVPDAEGIGPGCPFAHRGNAGRRGCYIEVSKGPDAVLAPAAGPAAEVGLQLSKRQMLRAAAGLFADKAVRSQPEVQDSVPGMTSPDADLILPKLAYIFRNGDTSLPVPGV